MTMRFGEGEDRGQSGAQDSDQSGEQASKQNAKNFGEVIHNSTGGLIAGHPLKATFFAMGPMSYRISWSVMGAGLANAGDTGEVHYRATMNLRNMKLSLQVISGMIEGDQPRAVGQCQRLPDNSPDGSPDTVQIGEIITEQG
ncbi:hypothetical protein [Phaeobacter sp.]|uniref:hypothetical protein n=1 Tax=Phaeobacter sp. TaxID=1902409 RepID=UPI0025CD2D45|nr:hypothetical protein [Phaeobacter sp.]